jgi:hypothetical protein
MSDAEPKIKSAGVIIAAISACAGENPDTAS